MLLASINQLHQGWLLIMYRISTPIHGLGYMKLWVHEDFGNSTLGILNQLVIGALIAHLLAMMVTAGHLSLMRNLGGGDAGTRRARRC